MTKVNIIPIICPKCQEKFKTTVARSFTYRIITTDLRPKFGRPNPMPLFVSRCPYCFFAGYVKEFQKIHRQLSHYEKDQNAFWKRIKELNPLKQSAVTNGASERFEITERIKKASGSTIKIAKIYKEAVNAIRINANSRCFHTYPSVDIIPVEIDLECAQKQVKAFQSLSKSEYILSAYIAAEHFRLAHEFDKALEWYEIYRKTVESVKDPPVSLDLVKIVEKEAKNHNFEVLYYWKDEKDNKISIKGLNN